MSDEHTPALSASQVEIEWRLLPGFPGYRATVCGQIQSCFTRWGSGKRGWVQGDEWKTLASSPDKAGRPCVRVSDGTRIRTRRVCVLILLAFVGPRPAGLECCHRNGDPADNRVENLYWGTHTDNMADRIRHGNYTRGSQHFNAKLTEDEVRLMRQLKRDGWSLLRLARRFRIAKTTVSQIVRGEFWRHVE